MMIVELVVCRKCSIHQDDRTCPSWPLPSRSESETRPWQLQHLATLLPILSVDGTDPGWLLRAQSGFPRSMLQSPGVC